MSAAAWRNSTRRSTGRAGITTRRWTPMANKTYYVRARDDNRARSAYTVYKGASLREARKALDYAERVLYGALASAILTHNLDGEEKTLDWIEGCPAEESKFISEG